MKFPKNWEEFETLQIAISNYHREQAQGKDEKTKLNSIIANNGAIYIKRKIFEDFGFDYWFEKYSTQATREQAFMKEFDKIGNEMRTRRFRKAESTWQKSAKNDKEKYLKKKKQKGK